MRKRDVVYTAVKALFVLVSLVMFLWLGGFAWYIANLPLQPDRPDQKTDGIVALTGGPYRISLAVSLLSDGLADRLLISGIYSDLEDETLRRANAIPKDIFACCIDLGRTAGNTEQNAKEAAAWVRGHGFTSIRVVTTFDHMPRSLTEFRRRMPHITLIPHPVSPDTVGQDMQWPAVGKLAAEYTKYWVALIRARVVPVEI